MGNENVNDDDKQHKYYIYIFGCYLMKKNYTMFRLMRRLSIEEIYIWKLI